ncbi:MAG TPA: aminotransferase class I/II-fold pyridoxal phosphate-dependent enzyme, partial [Spirochaetia bacterium]|nr:aminotransferase class I/II-fold pyridoxal phosphate-dependent enzyme [Spirochaetia bacterium]
AGEKAVRFNATAGVARQGGRPFIAKSLAELTPSLAAAQIVDYAPTGGDPALRKLWKQALEEKNPTLRGKLYSLPLVTAGITHGFSMSADLFIDEHDSVLIPAPAWENYDLILSGRRTARVAYYPVFNEKNGFNCEGLRDAIGRTGTEEKLGLVLNFPHNPTGYSLAETEANELVKLLAETAGSGRRLVVILDDAYFPLFYEDTLLKESLFARLVDLHENLLAVKLDGATKEYCAWGLRIGFLTLGGKMPAAPEYDALEEKLLAAVRTSVSSACRLSMSLLVRLLQNPEHKSEFAAFHAMLAARYRKVKAILAEAPPGELNFLSFNSGYFLTFHTGKVDAETLRRTLLDRHDIGTVALSPSLLRVTYASVDDHELPELFQTLFAEAARISAHTPCSRR